MNKFGPSPFSDNADLQALLDQFRESQDRLAQSRGTLYYTPRGSPQYDDDDEPTRNSSSTDEESSIDGSLNYARKAIRELRTAGKLSLDLKKAGEAENVQNAEVSSTTLSAAGAEDAGRSNGADSAADSDVARASNGDGGSSDEVCSSDKSVVEVAATERPATVSDVADGIAVCLT